MQRVQHRRLNKEALIDCILTSGEDVESQLRRELTKFTSELAYPPCTDRPAGDHYKTTATVSVGGG